MVTLASPDIQGLVVSAYRHLPRAAYILLRITDPAAARAYLRDTIPQITGAQGKQDRALNLALGYGGLARLGLHPDDLSTFPAAFQEGMASARRSRILGDTGRSAPQHWDWGGEGREVDILELVFAPDDTRLADLLGEREAARSRFGGLEQVGETLRTSPQQDNREHFGFNDGIAVPAVEGFPGEGQKERSTSSEPLKPGEFVLGYPDDYGRPAIGPTVDPSRDRDQHEPLPDAPAQSRSRPLRHLGMNGSYLAFRQIEQHVAAFWQFLDQATRSPSSSRDEAACERLAAKFVGRWLSGAPLVKHPDSDPIPAGSFSGDNDFGFATDRYGLRCPIGAHIRRANPRDSLESGPARSLRSTRRHAILRRSRPYGERILNRFQHDGQQRGIYFLCLNGDLERQFEFIQQTWLTNPVFGGLNGERDPLVGNPDGQGIMTFHANEKDSVRTRVQNLSSFVTIRGGAYFFMPGIRALSYLSRLGG
jgi:Dyp-type peroxidase family